MGLVRIFNPRTASEAAVVVAMLEAHEIPAYLHNGNLASVLPGVQINAYNGQSVMVPEECAPDALEMVANFRAAPARAGDGVVLVFNRCRKVWELPGGLIDPGETARHAVARELQEEAGCTARSLSWLGLVEVNDGATHLGAVFGCDADDVPATFQSDEIGAIGRARDGQRPRPLGESDAALLNRFG